MSLTHIKPTHNHLSILRPTRFFGTVRWFAMHEKGEYITDKANRPHSVTQPPQTCTQNQSIDAKRKEEKNNKRWHIFQIVNKPSESRFRSVKWTSTVGGFLMVYLHLYRIPLANKPLFIHHLSVKWCERMWNEVITCTGHLQSLIPVWSASTS